MLKEKTCYLSKILESVIIDSCQDINMELVFLKNTHFLKEMLNFQAIIHISVKHYKKLKENSLLITSNI